MYKILLAASLLLLLGAGTAIAQQVINHTGRSFSSDDGIAPYDDDGARNGTVSWSGSAIHIVNSYSVSPSTEFPNPVFIIRPGTIVKFAGTFSTNGGITWSPTSNGEFSAGTDNATLQFDGATITDIRDDAVGGDTNGDGNASTPSLAGWGYIRFSGSNRDRLNNSIIKYCTKIGHIGSMGITSNMFLFFGEFRSVNAYPGNTEPIVVNASPRFTGNTFQRSSGSAGIATLDLRGMSPVVENNTFRDSADVPAVWVGPAREFFDATSGALGPLSGTIIVSNNRFESSSAIALTARGIDPESLYSKIPIRAEIRSNTMRAQRNNGTALRLAFAADATVSDNTISNYQNPLVFFFDPQSQVGNRTRCGLRINSNRFSLEGVNSSYAVRWLPPPGSPATLSNVLIDMKNNDWGSPSGPLDTTVSDGRSNLRGQGLRIGSNTIDYVPFIGAGAPPQRDFVRLNVSSPSPSVLLAPGSSVTINSNIDFYDLLSAPTGQIVVLVRDADGIILNQPGTIVNVTSGNHTATVPPIQFTAPTLSNAVVVEANLAPAGNFPAVRSNLVSFTVNLPPSSLLVSGTMEDIPGNTNTARLNIIYTLASTNPGTIVLDFQERVVGTGTVLSQLPILTLPAPPGTGRTLPYTTTLLIPLRDVSTGLKREVVLHSTLKNDAGTVVSERLNYLRIDERANRVKLTTVVPIFSGPPLVPRQHFSVGSGPFYGTQFDYTIATQNATNWQVWLGFDKVLDASGATVYQYTAPAPAVTNASTGTVIGRRQAIQSGTPIQTGGRKYRVMIRLVAPGGLIVGLDSVDFPILSPDANQARVVAAGASVIAFSPITATLNFTANQTAGAAFAEEFNGQYGGAFANTSLLDPFYWRFIPLLRYWSVYDTLRNGTFTANVTFTYTPADIPSDPNFREDSLVVFGYNPLSQQLEALPSTLNRTARTVTTAYAKFFDTWVVASKSTILVSAPFAQAIPTEFSLGQNYPNPFNPATTIRFSLPQRSFVTLKLYDILGREVTTLVNEELATGTHQRTWNAANVSSGVYFYRVQTDNFVETKKLLLLR